MDQGTVAKRAPAAPASASAASPAGAMATTKPHPTKHELRMKRPARRQADPDAANQTQKVYEGTYNIWYNKWTGQKHKGRFEFGERAPTRVNVPKDTGYTLADKRKQQNPNHRTYFCLMFARGACHKGHKCEFLHRVPDEDDHEETMKDCFGRDRHRDERDDMNGVGCFNRENLTIYVGNLHPYEKGDGEKVILRHFSPFGAIDRVNVIHDKNIAFIRYKKRANAEFAKEAMEHQALDAGEIINVRWANDDPNPRAKAEAKRKLETEFVESYVKKKARNDDAQFMDEETRKLIEAHPVYKEVYGYYNPDEDQEQPLRIEGAPSEAAAAGPVNGQLQIEGAPPVPAQGETGEGATDEEQQAYMQAYYAQYYAQYYGMQGVEGDADAAGSSEQQAATGAVQYGMSIVEDEDASAAEPASAPAPPGPAPKKLGGLLSYASDDEDDE
ncbi:Pre-mRNA-splicing factor [Allomyces javanicus]|nr:Pre-mRNA-splicing factor [Allomyces javanicus]